MKTTLRTLMLLGFLTVAIPGFAPPPDDPAPNNPAVPVDGGLLGLAAAGAYLGYRKLKAKKEE